MNDVLLIDDDALALRLCMSALGSTPWRVTACSDGIEAMRLISTVPLRAVVTDLDMPACDGIDVIAETRMRQPDAKIAVVTCHSDVQIPTLTPADIVLSKPVDGQRLRIWLESVGIQ